MSIQRSLFDVPATAPVETASAWVGGVLSGSLAMALAVIAVALVGVLMLSGRLAVREAMQVVLGCFLLFGASAIAAGLLGASAGAPSNVSGPVATSPYVAATPPPPSPADYDPYSGASFRLDRR